MKSKDSWSSYTKVESIKDLTETEIKSATRIKAETFDKSGLMYAYLPENLSDGKYLICIKIEDTAGNSYCGPLAFYKKITTQAKPELLIDDSGTFIKYSIQNDCLLYSGANKKYGNNISVQYFDESSNTWKFFEGTSGYKKLNSVYYASDYGVGGDYNGYDKGTVISPKLNLGGGDTYTITLPNHFLRVYISECVAPGYPTNYEIADFDGFYYSKPLYFYNKKDSVSGILNKNAKGYVPYTAEPCIMTTVYSSINYGNDPDVWEQNTSDSNHIKTRQVNNLQLYEPEFDNVPAGNYYCVIVHYADGSSDMSEVKFK